MNSFHKGRYNIIVLLVYLITLQVSISSAFYSVYAFSDDGIVYVKQQAQKSNPKHNVILRRHLNVSYTERYSNYAAAIVSSISLPELKDFIYLKIPLQSFPLLFTAYCNLKNRAPPQVF